MELLVPATGPINTPLTAHRPNPLTPTTKTTVFFRKIQSFSNPFPRIASNGRKPILTRVSSSSSSSSSSPSVSSLTVVEDSPSVSSASCSRWMVVMEKPINAGSSKSEIIDYYVETLARVLGSEKEAQMCIYDASWQTQFGFCCDIDDEASRELIRLPGVLSVRPDRELEYEKKDYSYSNFLIGHLSKSNGRASKFSPSEGNSEYWLVQMEKPGVEVVTKAQMVDYYAQTLTKVLGNEKDAEVSIYNISWEKDFGFCCQIDEECARELADVPGVLSVRPDMNYESENKDYKGDANSQKSTDLADSSEADKIPAVKTKRLFVTGLSFYTSEKTLRAAFEGFGQLVEVKIIMDKISKRSKGYAFIEYTTEEAAGAALKEMNGKIINGWMIVVDVAKINPPKYSRGRPPPSSSLASSY